MGPGVQRRKSMIENIIAAACLLGLGGILLIIKFQHMGDKDREKWGLGPKGQGRK